MFSIITMMSAAPQEFHHKCQKFRSSKIFNQNGQPPKTGHFQGQYKTLLVFFFEIQIKRKGKNDLLPINIMR